MRKHTTFRIAALLALTAGLAACDMFSTLIDGWKYAQAVETDLQASTGMKPEVGFSWRNGRLEKVTVAFPRLYEAKAIARIRRNRAPRGRQSVQTDARRHRTFVLAGKIGCGQNGEVVRAGLAKPSRGHFRPAKFDFISDSPMFQDNVAMTAGSQPFDPPVGDPVPVIRKQRCLDNVVAW